MNEYLEFRLIGDTGKTQVYDVISRRHGNRLGGIHWYGAWYQYTLEPEANTIWNDGCLQAVIAFLGELREARGQRRVL